MYICDQSRSECNTVREPVCPRAPVSASSVTGTGPGAACKPPPEPKPTPEPPARLGCRINVRGYGKRPYSAINGSPSVKGC